jgi:hypothetical protein
MAQDEQGNGTPPPQEDTQNKGKETGSSLKQFAVAELIVIVILSVIVIITNYRYVHLFKEVNAYKTKYEKKLSEYNSLYDQYLKLVEKQANTKTEK